MNIKKDANEIKDNSAEILEENPFTEKRPFQMVIFTMGNSKKDSDTVMVPIDIKLIQ